MDANAKRYLKEFGGSMAAYAVMVPVSRWRLRGHEHTLQGYGIAFLPIIPSVLALWAFMRMFCGLASCSGESNGKRSHSASLPLA
jgi:hypothetical protein